jgi:hypothetical protein
MQGMGIGLGIDRDRADAHAVERANDAAGDFAAIGDQDFLEHGHSAASQTSTSIGVGL